MSGKTAKNSFLAGLEWPAVLCVVLVVGGAYYVLDHWIVYTHPAVAVNSQIKTQQSAIIHRNVVRTTTTTTPTKEGPLVTVVEEKDLTTEDTTALTSLVASSLSTPVFAPEAVFGIQAYRDVVGAGWLFGATVKPLSFFEVGIMTNEQFNKLMIGGTLWIK